MKAVETELNRLSSWAKENRKEISKLGYDRNIEMDKSYAYWSGIVKGLWLALETVKEFNNQEGEKK